MSPTQDHWLTILLFAIFIFGLLLFEDHTGLYAQIIDTISGSIVYIVKKGRRGWGYVIIV